MYYLCIYQYLTIIIIITYVLNRNISFIIKRNEGDNKFDRVANNAFNPPLAHSKERSANDTAKDISEGSVGTPNSYWEKI